jgi:hypothetical protein
MPYEGTDINPVSPYSDVAGKHRGTEPVSERRHRHPREKPKSPPQDVIEIPSEEPSEEPPEPQEPGEGQGLDISA